MPRERGGKICLRPTVDETRQMIKKLGKIENGCQIFYRCLRKTEHNSNHKYVADKLLKTGKWSKDKHYNKRLGQLLASPRRCMKYNIILSPYIVKNTVT